MLARVAGKEISLSEEEEEELTCCSLSLLGRNLSALEDTRDKCVLRGVLSDKILIVTADLQSERECREAVKKTLDYFGG